MDHLKQLFLLSLLVVGTLCMGSSDESDISSSEEERIVKGPLSFLFSGGALEDKPLLKMMLMRNMFGGSGHAGPLGGGPLASALTSGHAPAPMLRAMMMNRMQAAGQGSPNLMRALVLFRLMGERMGKKFIEAATQARHEDTVHVFQTSLACDCALEYVDEHGDMKGFAIDLVHEICEEAGKQCKVIYDLSSNCYTHHVGEHSRAGPGLLGHYYEACLGWMQTNEREHSVSFTRPFWHEGNSSHFFVKKGNPHGFDPHNVEGKAIGYADGWVTDKLCLKRHNTIAGVDSLHHEKTLYADDFEVLFQNLGDDKIDAVFLLDNYALLHDDVEAVGDSIECGSGNFHAMTSEDSHLPAWFDETLGHMMESGKYYAVCKKAQHDHSHKGDIKCMAPH
ncbi:putative ABC transporter arginine-binding protein 2 [Glandiceps talaboti]